MQFCNLLYLFLYETYLELIEVLILIARRRHFLKLGFFTQDFCLILSSHRTFARS